MSRLTESVAEFVEKFRSESRARQSCACGRRAWPMGPWARQPPIRRQSDHSDNEAAAACSNACSGFHIGRPPIERSTQNHSRFIGLNNFLDRLSGSTHMIEKT
jgi:hypothetical protein